jgi:hypothetical protein
MPEAAKLNTAIEFTPRQVEQSMHTTAEQVKKLREFIAKLPRADAAYGG